MMVDRRHPEHALSGQLETGDLDNHGYRLEHEDTADDRQHDLVAGDNADRAQRGPDRKRSGIAHEDHRRRCVVPKESQSCPHERSAKDSQFTGASDMMNL